MATKSRRNDNAGRNRKIAKFGLAGIAIIGVGAGLTSAAWTDNVWFGGDASAGNVNLQGSVDGGANWFEADTEGTRLTFDSAAFADMGPLDVRTVEVLVRNVGTTDLTITGVDFAESTGALFNGAIEDDLTPSAPGAVGTPVPNDGSEVTVTFQVVAPDWDDNDQDKTGVLIAQVEAQA